MITEKLIIIDYGMGNLRSVKNSFERIGAECIISSDLSEISTARKLILPGIGHFAAGVRNLKNLGIWDLLNQKVLIDKTPVLGICLGMQLMAKFSEEGNECGLGWFNAEVRKFEVGNKVKYKVPHIGWNGVSPIKANELFKDISKDAEFYFLHSFYIDCKDEKDVVATTEYETVFTSIIQKENIYGVQFHPEKSRNTGEQLLSNFLKIGFQNGNVS